MDSKETKAIADFLIADFESEIQTTLRVINSVPNDVSITNLTRNLRPAWRSSGISHWKMSGC
jgi:hypothetical protein